MENLKLSTSYRQIIKLAAPISIAHLIPQANFFTNNVFIGMLGQRELGVNAITSVFYLILSMVGYGLSSGIQVQLSRRAGEGDKGAIARTLSTGFLLSLAFSALLLVLAWVVMPSLFGNNLHDKQNWEMSLHFMHRRLWGIPFVMIGQLVHAFFIATSRSKLLMWGSLAATISNIALDYVLIFGHFNFPALGFDGAAVASVLAEAIFAATTLILFFSQKLHKVYSIQLLQKIDFNLVGRMIMVALPLIVQFLFSIGGWLIFFFFIEHLQGQALAASQMLRSIFGLVAVGAWALATTCNTMVSNVIGQGNTNLVPLIIKRVSLLSFSYTLILGIILWVFAYQFLSLYSSDRALILYAIPSLKVVVSGTLVMCIATTAFNAVVGTGNTFVNLSIEISCVMLYLVYCYIVIQQQHAPLHICWASEYVYWVSLLIFSFLYLKTGKWKGKSV
ncbi:MAG: MATE family efflux transporter [Chitinophagia bacterium]|nr:MATE family efflux transporter [Chitinophagia bacterium]